MVDRTSQILDAIDELVDEQMANFDNRSGYNHNVNQIECRICGEDSHSLAVTQRMREMRSRFRETINYYEDADDRVDQSVVDQLNAYSYAEDDSPIYCPGGDFIGPWAMPSQLRSMRYWAERLRAAEEVRERINASAPLSSPTLQRPYAYGGGGAAAHVDAGAWARMLGVPPEMLFPRRGGDFRYYEHFAPPVRPRWWRCEDIRELNAHMQERYGRPRSVGFGGYARRMPDARQVFLIVRGDEVELHQAPEGHFVRYADPQGGTVPQWMEIFAVRPPNAGEWVEMGEPLAEWERELLSRGFARVGHIAGTLPTSVVHDEMSPRQRALPRPSTTPPMWAVDPSRQRRNNRRRNG